MAAIVKPSERGLNDYQSHVSESTEIGWFGPRGVSPHWFDPKEKQFDCLIHEEKQRKLCLMFNAGESAVDFQLPHMLTTSQWYLVADTSRESPFDLCAPREESLYEDWDDYHLHPRSSVILKAHARRRRKRSEIFLCSANRIEHSKSTFINSCPADLGKR